MVNNIVVGCIDTTVCAREEKGYVFVPVVDLFCISGFDISQPDRYVVVLGFYLFHRMCGIGC